MNWTTGPLDPAVYWRRRAVVAVPILILLLVLATCAVKAAGSGGDDSNKAGKDKVVAKTQPSPAPAPSQPPASPATPMVQNPPVNQPPQPCGDPDLSVTAALAQPRYPANSRLPVKVAVTNTSGKACVRDVGPAQQEVLVKGAGDARIWSSDDCTNDPTSDARTLQPNEKRTYWVTWDSRTSAPGCPSANSGPAKPGTYQVVARFGTKFSTPVTVNLT